MLYILPFGNIILTLRRRLYSACSFLTLYMYMQDAVQDMRTRLSYKIDSVNNEFHCPLTPRNNKGEMINCHECSAQQLYHVVSV